MNATTAKFFLALVILMPLVSPPAHAADEPLVPHDDNPEMATQELSNTMKNGPMRCPGDRGYLALVSPLVGYNRNEMMARGGPHGQQPIKLTDTAPMYGLFLLLGNSRVVATEYLFYTKPSDTDVLGNLFYLNVYGDPEANITWNLGAGHFYHKIKPRNEEIKVNAPMLKAGPIIRIKPWGITLNPYLGYAWEEIETRRASVNNKGFLYGLSVDWQWRMVNLNLKYYYQDNRDDDESYNAVRARIVMGFSQHWGMSARYDYMEQMVGDNSSFMIGPVFVF